MKSSLRSTFAALLAALALACVGLGVRDGADAGHRRTSVLRQGGLALDVQRTLELGFLHGGRPALAGRVVRLGALPLVEPGNQLSGPPPLAAVLAGHRLAAGAHIHPALRPPFARCLSAARDGTLSARSTGVPPPALA
ncbi:MAG TPA: hypothetical protein VLK84_13915 [Longimicrobium sp.]|nr:hypothetical protein [Longimicrobium sp.]